MMRNVFLNVWIEYCRFPGVRVMVLAAHKIGMAGIMRFPESHQRHLFDRLFLKLAAVVPVSSCR